MASESSWHWVGVLVNLKVYAAAREGKRKTGIEKEIMAERVASGTIQHTAEVLLSPDAQML